MPLVFTEEGFASEFEKGIDTDLLNDRNEDADSEIVFFFHGQVLTRGDRLGCLTKQVLEANHSVAYYHTANNNVKRGYSDVRFVGCM